MKGTLRQCQDSEIHVTAENIGCCVVLLLAGGVSLYVRILPQARNCLQPVFVIRLISQISLGPLRHVTTRTTCRACRVHISTLLSFPSVNFRFYLDYLYSEPRR